MQRIFLFIILFISCYTLNAQNKNSISGKVIDSLSKTPILDKKLNDFKDYKQEEENNPSLKKYLDTYRLEYALQYKIAGNDKKSKELFKNILKENIPFKTRLIYFLPRFVLIFLLKIKKFLRKNGFNFSIYN